MALGLEAAGFETAAFCEVDPFCRAVLRKHWPEVWIRDDVRTLTGQLVFDRCGRIDCIAGGPPCQPASCAGKRKGSADERWLWGDYLRLVREVRPLLMLAENPCGIITLKPHGLDWIRDELAQAGYETVPVVVGARHVGAPHRRDRVWLIGRLADTPRGGLGTDGSASGRAGHVDEQGAAMAHAGGHDGNGSHGQGGSGRGVCRTSAEIGMADPNGVRAGEPERAITAEPRSNAGTDTGWRGRRQRWPARPGERQHEWEAPRLVQSAGKSRRCGDAQPERKTPPRIAPGWSSERRVLTDEQQREISKQLGSTLWLAEPGLGVSANGASRRLASLARRNALRALGNAVVWQAAEQIGRAMKGII